MVMLSLIASSALAKEHSKLLKVAVIDTGLDKSAITHLCSSGHKSFASRDPLKDNHGHGTHVGGLIEQAAHGSKYCMISLQFFDPTSPDTNTRASLVSAIDSAIKLKVDYINISAGGVLPDKQEKKLITKALNRHIKVVVAAGNESSNLDKKCSFFPACYDNRLVVVGNMTAKGTKFFDSNYGSVVNRWEMGTDVYSKLPGHNLLGKMTGTSQATAIATGKLLKQQFKNTAK